MYLALSHHNRAPCEAGQLQGSCLACDLYLVSACTCSWSKRDKVYLSLPKTPGKTLKAFQPCCPRRQERVGLKELLLPLGRQERAGLEALSLPLCGIAEEAAVAPPPTSPSAVLYVPIYSVTGGHTIIIRLHENTHRAWILPCSHTQFGSDDQREAPRNGTIPPTLVRAGPLLRGIILNRTYGPYKNLYILPFLPTMFSPINYGPS